MSQPPTAYIEGYAKGRLYDEALADNYIRHTAIGDPALDPVMEELSSMNPGHLHRFVGAGIEQHDEVLREAPKSLRDFFENLEDPPWLDHQAFRPGVRAFHANVDLMLIAFVTGVLVEGFATLISKSFYITGRVGSTKRRLQQNNRQLLDIFFPGGLNREGDGWKLSTRVRFVHARIRSLLAKSDDWNTEAWGTPLSAAHLGFAISVFSRLLLEYAKLLGAKFSKEEYDSVLAVWRYAGYLMGIPDAILYTDRPSAERMYKIGKLCEPEPDADAAAVANMLIDSIPKIADIQDPAEQQRVTALARRLSRALIGNELADHYQYPRTTTFGTLFMFRMKQRLQRMLKSDQLIRSGNFSQMIQISVYDEGGLSYKMPDHVHSSKSNEW
ncbi:MAG: oxygenase MpaB family protein [Deltaproteobacteria bacterium]|nr:oxygenase MpaB family protein [Deltaproteobacteria bacterium]